MAVVMLVLYRTRTEIRARRLKALIDAMHHRLDQIRARAGDIERVLELHQAATEAVERFARQFDIDRKLREQVRKRLKRVTHGNNIDFGGLARVSHATDATDWRVAFPFVVISPDDEAEVASIVRACIDLGLTIIPRGGGTGYTGGAVPLDAHSVVINTEKLDRLGHVEPKAINGVEHPVATVHCGAGVVTRRVSELAAQHGRVFAVDPTSASASCVGGNIAVNFVGKNLDDPAEVIRYELIRGSTDFMRGCQAESVQKEIGTMPVLEYPIRTRTVGYAPQAEQAREEGKFFRRTRPEQFGKEIRENPEAEIWW